MEAGLWKDCLFCKSKNCCSLPVFVTKEEENIIKKHSNKSFKKNCLCSFFNEKGLCEIHKIRPTDCRFFPFDIIKIKNKFFWIIWSLPKNSCNMRKLENFEDILSKFEKELLPSFRKYLKNYSDLKLNDFVKDCQFKIIREVRLKNLKKQQFL